ncbi:Holliday junction branch migration protein RuvA [Candidatus Falkowbacteria bacterium]|jgi:Holliday junction DNA helicase RuvA|nr:Holliday junction branch migration protein RuvA [Candidatus Falkowbacteria bacterium]
MIAYLRGKIISKSSNYIILEVNNIGYQIFAGENFLNELKVGGEAEIFTHHQIKEDVDDLYGFKTAADLELFKLLLTVSGVGPKSALGVISIASSEDIKETIIRGDAALLTKVAGIGKKTAERIVLELKTKVLRGAGEISTLDTLGVSGSDEIDALMTLGYSLNEARTALNMVEQNITDSGERVKAALKKMVKR